MMMLNTYMAHRMNVPLEDPIPLLFQGGDLLQQAIAAAAQFGEGEIQGVGTGRQAIGGWLLSALALGIARLDGRIRRQGSDLQLGPAPRAGWRGGWLWGAGLLWLGRGGCSGS